MTPIYHITHLSNLLKILAEGGLWCDRETEDRDLAAQSLAHAHIKARRRLKVVPCGSGGVLSDYVPFYFAPRSPMLFVIDRNGVEGYTAGQDEVLHLVSSTEQIVTADLDYVFTDGHAPMALSKFFDDVEDLDEVDWSVMELKYWNDIPDFPDRCRRRQAEFLVKRFVPFERFTEIGVCNEATARKVRAVFEEAEQEAPRIVVRSAWYY